MCSQDDAHELRIKFCNNDNSHVCDVFWVDYDGRDVHRKRLEPGESYMEASFVSHPWRVRDCATGEALDADGGHVRAHQVSVWVAKLPDAERGALLRACAALGPA